MRPNQALRWLPQEKLYQAGDQGSFGGAGNAKCVVAELVVLAVIEEKQDHAGMRALPANRSEREQQLNRLSAEDLGSVA